MGFAANTAESPKAALVERQVQEQAQVVDSSGLANWCCYNDMHRRKAGQGEGRERRRVEEEQVVAVGTGNP